MSFSSAQFWGLFLPVVFVLYLCVRKKAWLQNLVLVLAGAVFYACYEWKYLFFLLAAIIVTYGGTLWGQHLSLQSAKKARAVWVSTIVLNIGMLAFFKYAGFAVRNLNVILGLFGGHVEMPQILLPIGLSFYIFSSVSYVVDVMRARIPCEKNLLTLAAYVSFFPSITSGPIQRGAKLLPQLRQSRTVSYRDVQRALFGFLWGAFLKMVLADRIAIFTSSVFSSFEQQGGFVLAVAACAYSIQIYADFAGYSCMAIALANLFGLSSVENFRQPYFGRTIQDFWRRWHISLTSWFTDYLYIPLGGNRKGIVRKYLNIAIVFLVSGLWHGAAWTFVMWGALHAIYQIVGQLTKEKRAALIRKMGIRSEGTVYRLWQSCCIFALVTFAWIFFFSPDIGSAFRYIGRMFSVWNPWVLVDRTLFTFGLSAAEFNIVLVALGILCTVSYMHERGKSVEVLLKQKLPVRFALYFLMIAACLVLGIYGPAYNVADFIYAGF